MSKLVEDFLSKYGSKTAEELYHHGIKGQKWGVIRSRSARAARRKEAASSDATTVKELKKQARKKGLESLSNEQLQVLNKRLELEKKYQKWAKDNPTLQHRAAKFIAQTMIQEAQREILGQGSGSPLGTIARKMNDAHKLEKGTLPKHHKTRTPKPPEK